MSYWTHFLDWRNITEKRMHAGKWFQSLYDEITTVIWRIRKKLLSTILRKRVFSYKNVTIEMRNCSFLHRNIWLLYDPFIFQIVLVINLCESWNISTSNHSCKYCMNIDFLYHTISVLIYQKYGKTEIIHVRNKNSYNMRISYWISPDPNKTTITQ